jgi:NAD(P)-dependent dehydrogenase (short-subunit alcohol dehydrogenase family)
VGKLDGKVAIVTGASSGIGLATAKALGAEGAQVILAGRTLSPMVQAAAAIAEAGGPRAFPRVADVRDETHVRATVDYAAEKLGGLHIIVNSAGVNHFDNVIDGDVEKWRETFEVNVIGLMLCCREAARVMRQQGGGHIVNISSVAARHVEADNVAYSASKYAVDAVTDGIRQALRPHNIRVTAIMPGAVLTNMARNMPEERLRALGRAFGIDPDQVEIRPGQPLPPEILERVGQVSQRVLLRPEDIADTVLYAVTQPETVQVNELVVQPPQPTY